MDDFFGKQQVRRMGRDEDQSKFDWAGEGEAPSLEHAALAAALGNPMLGLALESSRLPTAGLQQQQPPPLSLAGLSALATSKGLESDLAAAALRQKLLNEQACMDLLKQAGLLDQRPQPFPHAPTPSILPQLLQQQPASQPGISSSLKKPPPVVIRPFKRQRLDRRDDDGILVVSLSKEERKSTFPLPSTQGDGHRVSPGSLSSFRKRWNRLQEKSTVMESKEVQEAFVAEFFRRALDAPDFDRLYRKVHGLSSREELKRQREEPAMLKK